MTRSDLYKTEPIRCAQPLPRSRVRRTCFFLWVGLAILCGGCSFSLLRGNPQAGAKFEPLDAFTINNPYQYEGTWYKAQLHVHTAASLDSQWPAESAITAYAHHGYDFVALTDHDGLTQFLAVADGLVLISGEENTIANPIYPLGVHAVFLFIERRASLPDVGSRFEAVNAQGGLVSLAHPTWNGNIGYGSWDLWQAMAAPQFTLVEVYNPHSDTERDEAFWHDLLVQRGPDRPVWAVAVDDSHKPGDVNRGWTMVLADAKTPEALRQALLRGSHYATTGLNAHFWVDGNTIHTEVSEPAHIEFIDGRGGVVKHVRNATQASYEPKGEEGFIRIRLHHPGSRRWAWSQPFWLVKGE